MNFSHFLIQRNTIWNFIILQLFIFDLTIRLIVLKKQVLILILISRAFKCVFTATNIFNRKSNNNPSSGGLRHELVSAAIYWGDSTARAAAISARECRTTTTAATILFASWICNSLFSTTIFSEHNPNKIALYFGSLDSRQSIFATTASGWTKRGISIFQTKAIEISTHFKCFQCQIESIAHFCKYSTMPWRSRRLFSSQYRCTKFYWKFADHRFGYNRSAVSIPFGRCSTGLERSNWGFPTVRHCFMWQSRIVRQFEISTNFRHEITWWWFAHVEMQATRESDQ